MSLPTNGRVIVETTVGELDIELWSKVSSARQRCGS
jgi:peptidyl-prolyl cis-trans isomerase SDCCAG10